MSTVSQCATRHSRSRNLVAYSLLSLDGVAEEPGDWMFEVDDEVFDFLGRVIATQDDVLLGRGTYEYWVDYWPGSSVEPFASFINSTPKHVFSSTPLTGKWNHEIHVVESVDAYIRDLKATPGQDIGVHGSISLTQSLIAMALVDEIHLIIVPTIAGRGTRLFPTMPGARRLKNLYQSRTSRGNTLLSYEVLR